jgi:hypothetical protein
MDGKPVKDLGPLWTCPRCGRKFVSRNIWHSCTDATVDSFLAGNGPRARALFDRFEQLVALCGPYDVSPAKTRVAFMGRVRFAGVTRISDREMICSFALPYPLNNPRFTKIEQVVPGWYAHRLRITDPEQLDDEVLGWLRESYRLMGMQERLREKPARNSQPKAKKLKNRR